MIAQKKTAGRYELATLALWLIAVTTTLVVVRGTGLFTYLGPVLFICMVGSILVVRRKP
ncbi:MAG: hypothetical protein ACE5F6_05220 [Anaerolineae bacterium]